MRYMSIDCPNSNHFCCNNNNEFENLSLLFNNPFFYTIAIVLLFGGGGFSPSSFWGSYGNIFRCSAFNNGWCNDINLNNTSFNTLNTPFNNNFFNTTNNSGLLTDNFN